MIHITQADISPGMIDLALGHPSTALLPVDLLRQAADHHLSRGDPSSLAYGFEQGDDLFRENLGEFLSEQYQREVRPEHLFVTNGVSQGLDLICTLFSQPGDTIFVEDPTYFLALRIFADHRLTIVSLPTDHQGLDIDALEQELDRQKPVFLYTIPIHQNPTGATLSPDRRKRLANLVEKHRFLVLADEVYHPLSYTAEAPPPLSEFVKSGGIISLGSFSKILAPGLRLGWIQTDPDRLRTLMQSGLLDSGGGLNPFGSGVVRSTLELGLLPKHIEHLRSVYGARLKRMSAALKTYLPHGSFAEPAGGFFFWVRLPNKINTKALLQRAKEHKIRYLAGQIFSQQNHFSNCLRLSFSYFEEEQIEEGIRRLARVIDT